MVSARRDSAKKNVLRPPRHFPAMPPTASADQRNKHSATAALTFHAASTPGNQAESNQNQAIQNHMENEPPLPPPFAHAAWADALTGDSLRLSHEVGRKSSDLIHRFSTSKTKSHPIQQTKERWRPRRRDSIREQ